MVRDPLRDEQYFDKYIKFEDESILEFKELLNSVIEERGIHDKGAQNGLRAIRLFHFNKLNAMYSGGRDLKEIKDFVPEVIESMQKAWKGHYLEMLWILSIGIMLDIDQKYFEQLEKLIREHDLKDSLIDYLLSSKVSSPQILSDYLLQEDPYQKLISITRLNDKQEQVQMIKAYLENHWYPGHEDTEWHDSHKHQDDIYNGYWSYESGAVAKILGLDDSNLKDVPYYPYDMVHYKD